MLIEQLIEVGEEEALAASMADLDAFYKQARARFNGDPSFAERAGQRVVLLQAARRHTLAPAGAASPILAAGTSAPSTRSSA